jgi:hypothetical protein
MVIMLQLVPFHDSAMSTGTAPLPKIPPTAMQLVEDRQEIAVNAPSLTWAFGDG